MKKMILVLIIFLAFITGCNKNNDVINKFKNKVEKSNSYYLNGELEIANNENIYKYDIEVSYKKEDNFKVLLKNKINDHIQIILKNKTGVYVLTPSLNKSFKFQSEWPYNNSESYLLTSVLDDIENDSNKNVEKTKNGYVITTKVNYPNNKELKNQKIYLNNNGDVKKIEVKNDKEITKIKMKYNKITYNKKFDKKYFDLNSNMDSDKTTISNNKIIDTIYPMYVPKDTYLDTKEVIADGERMILTFSGESPFTIIEETIKPGSSIEEVSGEIEMINDVLGYYDKGFASWISDGIEYYAVSDNIDDEELIKVVNSMSSIPVGK